MPLFLIRGALGRPEIGAGWHCISAAEHLHLRCRNEGRADGPFAQGKNLVQISASFYEDFGIF